ncbi:hypothetical protein V5799_008739, partial [Amblyomma americanum]
NNLCASRQTVKFNVLCMRCMRRKAYFHVNKKRVYWNNSTLPEARTRFWTTANMGSPAKMRARIEDGVVHSPFPAVEIPCCLVYEAAKEALLRNPDKLALVADAFAVVGVAENVHSNAQTDTSHTWTRPWHKLSPRKRGTLSESGRTVNPTCKAEAPGREIIQSGCAISEADDCCGRAALKTPERVDSHA